MGALALTGQPGKAEAFAPLPGGVSHISYGDPAALDAAVGEQTAMVLLEPMLGEGGMLPGPPGYLAGALFALDEVQIGMGRTGSSSRTRPTGFSPARSPWASRWAAGCRWVRF